MWLSTEHWLSNYTSLFHVLAPIYINTRIYVRIIDSFLTILYPNFCPMEWISYGEQLDKLVVKHVYKPFVGKHWNGKIVGMWTRGLEEEKKIQTVIVFLSSVLLLSRKLRKFVHISALIFLSAPRKLLHHKIRSVSTSVFDDFVRLTFCVFVFLCSFFFVSNLAPKYRFEDADNLKDRSILFGFVR
ncbi:unnamed protein product [Citrullus colocynthis]|uniref:Uncharacterized protein n=1 Tax=Citrullus colocynthis TaxID=252529 RepID=A0ABP0Y9A2_9ROSI